MDCAAGSVSHSDHVNLLRDGIPSPGGVWADLGSGTGAFTLALADLIGDSGVIYSVDRDAGALRSQEQAMRARFPATRVQYLRADFTQRLDLLDSIERPVDIGGDADTRFTPTPRRPSGWNPLKRDRDEEDITELF